MKRAAVVLGSLFFSASVAGAQSLDSLALSSSKGELAQDRPQTGAAQPAPMTNLQVLSKDMTRQQVQAQMQQIAAALGVQCNYCHVMEGRGGRNDMASDEKPTKKTARQMMIFTRELNAKLPAVVGKTASDTTGVGCTTCHRGMAIPKLLPQVLSETVAAKGLDAAIAQYRELRAKYMGAMAYDLSEGGLITMAQQANAADRADNALAWLNLNLEFYPQSSRTYQVRAQVKNGKGDKAGAIADLEKAVQLDPNNNQAKAQLQQLKGQ